MSRTFVQPGKVLEYVNGGSAIAAGDIIVSGDIVLIALVDIPSGETGNASVAGVHKVAKVAGTAWVQGEKIDWDASLAAFSVGIITAAGDVTSAGVAAKAAGSADTIAELLLTPGEGTGI